MVRRRASLPNPLSVLSYGEHDEKNLAAAPLSTPPPYENGQSENAGCVSQAPAAST